MPFNSMKTKKTLNEYKLAKSKDTDEMPHDVAFYQCLHCLIRQNQSSEKETQSVTPQYKYNGPF